MAAPAPRGEEWTATLSPALCLQDRDFLAKQKEDLEQAMRRVTAENRREICNKERECLSRKQALLRGARGMRSPGRKAGFWGLGPRPCRPTLAPRGRPFPGLHETCGCKREHR